jgi:hypothetical protein
MTQRKQARAPGRRPGTTTARASRRTAATSGVCLRQTPRGKEDGA